MNYGEFNKHNIFISSVFCLDMWEIGGESEGFGGPRGLCGVFVGEGGMVWTDK